MGFAPTVLTKAHLIISEHVLIASVLERKSESKHEWQFSRCGVHTLAMCLQVLSGSISIRCLLTSPPCASVTGHQGFSVTSAWSRRSSCAMDSSGSLCFTHKRHTHTETAEV